MFAATILLMVAIIMILGGLAAAVITFFANAMQTTYQGFQGGWIFWVGIIVFVLGIALGIHSFSLY